MSVAVEVSTQIAKQRKVGKRTKQGKPANRIGQTYRHKSQVRNKNAVHGIIRRRFSPKTIKVRAEVGQCS